MKKQLCLLLALTLVFAMTACGKKEAPAANIAPSPNASDPRVNAQAVAAPTAAPTQAPTEAPTEAPAEPVNPLTLGRMEGGTYTNTYAGFRCTLDTDWVFRSAQELQELPENVEALFQGTDAEEMMSGLDSITDMMAENSSMLCNMNVLYQKMDEQVKLGYSLFTPEQILDEVLLQKDTLISTYAQAGIQVTRMEKVFVNFLGQSQPALYSVGSVQDIPVYFTQIFDYTKGDYAMTLTFTSYYEDNSQYMLDLFTTLDGQGGAHTHTLTALDFANISGQCPGCGQTLTGEDAAKAWLVGSWAERMVFNADGSVVYHTTEGDEWGTWTYDGPDGSRLKYTVQLEGLTITAGIYGDDPTIITMADKDLYFQYIGQKD